MNRFAEPAILALAWLAFIGAGPRFLDESWLTGLTLLGVAATFVVLSRHGLVRRKDPLSLSSTGRRPYFETR